MKTTKILTIVLGLGLLTSCQQKKDDPEVLKKILTDYFDGIKTQDLEKLNSLTGYSGPCWPPISGISWELESEEMNESKCQSGRYWSPKERRDRINPMKLEEFGSGGCWPPGPRWPELFAPEQADPFWECGKVQPSEMIAISATRWRLDSML